MEKLWLRYLKPTGEECGEKIRLPTTNEIVDWVQLSYETTKTQKVRKYTLVNNLSIPSEFMR